MHVLKIIRDSDVSSDAPVPGQYTERKATRAVIFDTEMRVALLHVTNKGYHELPGGGVEMSESIEDALRRETSEEIGCTITNIRELGIVEEYRNEFAMHQVSYCFVAELLGVKGQPNLEADEIADGFVPEWMPINQAIEILESEVAVKHYEAMFIRLRDLTFLKEAAMLTQSISPT